MTHRTWLAGLACCLALALPLVIAAPKSAPVKPAAAKASDITWKKTVLDKEFISEGVTVADVNKDGKMDIITGERWYEAPDWKMHEICKSKDYTKGQTNVYSNSFACWPVDLNGDGYPDVIVIGFPGRPCHWYENPKGKAGHWKKHEIWHSACNETPQYVDLFKNGKPVLLMGWHPKGGKGHEHRMSYFTPGKVTTKTWEEHPISGPAVGNTRWPGTFHFDHGLGVGDVNGDGKLDVIVAGGWYEQPSKVDGKTAWKFHPVKISDACADMYAVDVDGDGKADIISSSAHGFGIWWHKQNKGKDGKITFATKAFYPKLVSQTHALNMADINNDGTLDLITGKRWWAHGPKGDADAAGAAMVYWFEGKKNADGLMEYKPHVIDKDSGIGTQFAVADVNGDGLLDVVTSNKKGTFLLEQVRKKK